MPASISKGNVATWPKSIRQAVDAISAVFSTVYELARTRGAAHRSSTTRAMAQTDDAIFNSKLLEREADILRRNREGIPSRRRPHYSPDDRLEIIQLMRLRGWSVDETAGHFAIHPNTLASWLKELETDPDSSLFTGVTPVNKIGDAVRAIVHRIRELCPEREFGTRSIAMQIIRAGVQLGRTTVQQILREQRPSAPRPAPFQGTEATKSVTPHHILRPKAINRTWHLDLTTFEFLWVRFYVAAILDGYSRNLLALRVYADAPRTNHVRCLLQECIRRFGAPRFLVTDHGCQFRKRFNRAMKKFGVEVVKGRTDSKRFNGKMERFFRTLKLWQRVALLAASLDSIQRRLDRYQAWYNSARPMIVLNARTPDETWAATPMRKAVAIRTSDPQPVITVVRRRYRNDPHLFRLDFQIKRPA